MSAAHTPGPWSYYTEPQPNGCPIVGAMGLMVAQLAHSINYNDQSATAIANARLIAAAPDLLEVLRLTAHTLPHIGGNASSVHNLIQTIEQAISKATGVQQ